MVEQNGEGRSLFETPSWAVATVITLLVSLSFLFHTTLTKCVKWLDRTKRKSLLSALEKIKEELMLFGLLSLLMGHWIIFVDIQIKQFPKIEWTKTCIIIALRYIAGEHGKMKQRLWPYKAYMVLIFTSCNDPQNTPRIELRRLSTFIFHHTSHPWSNHKILVWLLCFSRQFWSSINRADYMALRLGFITRHELPLTYDFHNYMLRSMDDEFRDIVGVSVLLWIYAICCIFLNFHGSNFYFWLSFVPAILILIIGTKLHRVVVKLAVEVLDGCPFLKPHHHQFNLRDELFWFGNPRFLLRIIHLISFLNAFEMASFLWSLWEIKEPSCFMKNKMFIVIRLSFGWDQSSRNQWCLRECKEIIV